MENFIFYAIKEKIGWLVSIWLSHQMSNVIFQQANESSQAFISWECFLIPPVIEFFNQIVLNNTMGIVAKLRTRKPENKVSKSSSREKYI